MFGLATVAGLELAAYGAGAKFGILGGAGAAAEIASKSAAQKGATILSTPASTFSKFFGLQVRAAAADSAFSLAARLGAASDLAFKAARGLGSVGAAATVAGTSFYATARAYCELGCLGK